MIDGVLLTDCLVAAVRVSISVEAAVLVLTARSGRGGEVLDRVNILPLGCVVFSTAVQDRLAEEVVRGGGERGR